MKYENEVNCLTHNNCVIVCNNIDELNYVIDWCDDQGKNVAPCIRSRIEFPFCLGVSGKSVSWLDEMDRAVYYVEFNTFVDTIYKK